MNSQIAVPSQHLVSLVKLAAQYNASVESVVAEAIAAYLADVDSGLLVGPRETPMYELRPRRRLESLEGYGRPRRR